MKFTAYKRKKIWHGQPDTKKSTVQNICCLGLRRQYLAPLTDYINNLIYQELVDEDQYGKNKSDERVYLNLRASSAYINKAEKLERNDSKINLTILLKNAATKKLRQRIWAHSIGQYLYILTRSGLTLRHKAFSILQQDETFLERIENNQ